MSKFIIRTTLFCILVLAGYLFIVRKIVLFKDDYTGFSYSYMSGITIKHKRAEEIKQPKIVFIGGSNVAYGINSEMIEKAFSIPVVNLGLHGGLGVPFILSQAQKLIKKGDIVFVSIEYFMGNGDYRLIEQTCLEFPEVADFHKFSLKQEIQLHLSETREGLVQLLEGNKEQKKEKNKTAIWEMKNKDQLTPGSKFNKYGDYIDHLYHDGWYVRRSDETKSQYRYWEGIELMNQFKAELEGVDMFYIYPSLAKSNYDVHVKTIEKFSKDLANNLDIEVLNTPEDFVFEDRYFYDTHYHLTAKGREMRTKKQLQFFMENERVRHSIEKAFKAE